MQTLCPFPQNPPIFPVSFFWKALFPIFSLARFFSLLILHKSHVCFSPNPFRPLSGQYNFKKLCKEGHVSNLSKLFGAFFFPDLESIVLHNPLLLFLLSIFDVFCQFIFSTLSLDWDTFCAPCAAYLAAVWVVCTANQPSHVLLHYWFPHDTARRRLSRRSPADFLGHFSSDFPATPFPMVPCCPHLLIPWCRSQF